MLAAGTTLGPYRILAPLGAGGMGEVYRARDTRLSRDVAIKVIPPALAADPDRLGRFEQEARAAGALNHPNIVTIFDFGSHQGTPYVVMELLEGESVRERLRHGPLPVRKAMDVASQAAEGLAAAHAKGIVHRDLKPENLFVTKDGRVKVLDFGLAKLTDKEALGGEEAETLPVAKTGQGVVLGTVGYMAPEQVRGKGASARSDIFALGAILHEMLTGQRAFRGASQVETLNAILTAEPASLVSARKEVPPALETVVRRCLEKEPGQRFASARDVALALEVASAGSGEVAALPAAGGRRRLALALAALALLAAGYAALFFVGQRTVSARAPELQRVTYRRGQIGNARFTPDGQAVVYGARWLNEGFKTFSQRLGTPDPRELGLSVAVVATFGGEMAVLRGNTLGRVAIDGGTPRDLVSGVTAADASADGARFAVVLGAKRLEYPVGHERVRAEGLAGIFMPRISPRGDRVAYNEQTSPGSSDEGGIVVVDTLGRRRVLVPGPGNEVTGLAWSPDGGEVWFSGMLGHDQPALYAVDLEGRVRELMRSTSDLRLMDVAQDRRVLVAMWDYRWETRGRMAGDSAERDLSWLDFTITPYLSPDGTRMLFQEGARGGAAYLRRAGDSTVVRLADASPFSVSPDWKAFLAGTTTPYRLDVVPIGAGQTRTLPAGKLTSLFWANWGADGRVYIEGAEAGKEPRDYVQDLAGGEPQPLASDSARIDWRTGKPARPIPGLTERDQISVYGSDGRSLFVTHPGAGFAQVSRIDLQTGRRQPWLDLVPQDLAGARYDFAVPAAVTPDGRYYAYCYSRTLGELYVIEGLR